ncbi:protein disulfide-isomerase [Physcia stellaris]|nr:protein disulfide-isomerase [Physcia stellaris]
MARSFPPAAVQSILSEVTGLLKQRKETISIAETAAGGIISASLLSTPGASSFYKGGLTLYTLESRIAYAGWTQENIQNYKGPTPDIVKGLAENWNGRTDRWEHKEQDTVSAHIPFKQEEQGTHTKEVETGLGGDREENMIAFSVEALRLLKEVMKGEAKL